MRRKAAGRFLATGVASPQHFRVGGLLVKQSVEKQRFSTLCLTPCGVPGSKLGAILLKCQKLYNDYNGSYSANCW